MDLLLSRSSCTSNTTNGKFSFAHGTCFVVTVVFQGARRSGAWGLRSSVMKLSLLFNYTHSSLAVFRMPCSHCVVLLSWLCSQFHSEGGNPMTQQILLLICPGASDPVLRSPAARWYLTCLCSAALCDVEHYRTGSLLTLKTSTVDGKCAPVLFLKSKL